MWLTALASVASPAGLVIAVEPAVPYVWHDVAVGGGGYVSGVFAHPAAPGLMYAKTDVGGAYRRDSATSPWVPITDWIDQNHWTYSGIESLALDPNDPDAVFIAGGTYTNAWGGAGAFLRSFDRGKTWAIAAVPFKMGGNEKGRGQGERLAVDPNDGRVLFFGSRKNGLWHSTDRGQTWSQVAGYPEPADAKGFGTPVVLFAAASGKKGTPTPTIVAGCNSKTIPLLRSTDGGTTWTPIAGAPQGLLPHRAAFGTGEALFITFGNGIGPNEVTGGALYRVDADDKWTEISPVKPDGADKFGYAGICVDTQDPKTILVSTLDRWGKSDDVFLSHDNGATWTGFREKAERDPSAAPWITFERKTASFGHWISSVAIDPFDPNHLIYVTGWGMWETHDAGAADHGGGTHWTFAATGVNEGVINEVLSPPRGAHVLSVLWDIDGFRHEDVDRSPPAGFFKPWAGRDTSIDFAENAPDFVVRVFGGQILGKRENALAGGAYSTDNGVNWTLFPHKPADAIDGTVAVSADGATIVWTPANQATVVSPDRGRTWTPAAGLPWNLRVVTDRVEAGRCYACDSATGVVYSSRDSGSSFQAVSTHGPAGSASLRPQPGRAGRLWLATRSGLLRSDDGGATFVRLAGIDNALRVGFGLSPSAGPAVYLVGQIEKQYGFFRSDDDGLTWVRINDDAHQFMEITSITGDPRVPGRVYLSSRNRGVLRGDPPLTP